ncbi:MULTISPECIES: RNA polymerase sigma factor [Flavobacteriaceae]|uniref:RNA polymerase sigma factor n=1 Tax=Flavobacteriaceae TaxID=49546 RepID=UPI001493083E|nr:MULTISPECIES: RNA polymerase sigma-70 factor [Allomuricauda]MDC6365860.1 RNA polymerase sigma-70 factor [Muricauda sp. AC10]
MNLDKKFQDNKILISALKNGDEKAYMFLLDEYHSKLHAYALGLINDFSMAQDIVQTVFLKTWQFRQKLDARFSIQGFLYKLVYNEFVNTYQKNQSTLLLQRKYIESLNNVVEKTDKEEMATLVALVTKEIAKLPARCQQIFNLSKSEGLTNMEIAEHLNISVKTVENQITKAYSILRKQLKDKFEMVMFLVFGQSNYEIQ